MQRGDDWHRRHAGTLSAARFQRSAPRASCRGYAPARYGFPNQPCNSRCHGIVFTSEPFRLRLFTQRHIDVISSQTHSPSVARLSNGSFFALFAMHENAGCLNPCSLSHIGVSGGRKAAMTGQLLA